MAAPDIHALVADACRRLLEAQNRDPSARTFGCFDHAFWSSGRGAVDPGCQAAVLPLARRLGAAHLPADEARHLREAIRAGLRWAVQIQLADGSFEPHRLPADRLPLSADLTLALLSAYRLLPAGGVEDRAAVEECLRRGADYLHRHIHTETGAAAGAAAALALIQAGALFGEARYGEQAGRIVQASLRRQSAEGWLREDEGADPSRLTQALDHLAQIAGLQPHVPELRAGIERAAAFLTWFVHPDGGFGRLPGDACYPGGLALLSGEIPAAASITRAVLGSDRLRQALAAAAGSQLAALTASAGLALGADVPETAPPLPWQSADAQADFLETGLFVRGTARYYAVLAASSGGTLRVTERNGGAVLWADAGYSGQLDGGESLSSAFTDHSRRIFFRPDAVEVEAMFMRGGRGRLWLEAGLRWLHGMPLADRARRMAAKGLNGGQRTTLRLVRSVTFEPEQVIVSDRLDGGAGLKVQTLRLNGELLDAGRLRAGETLEKRREIG